MAIHIQRMASTMSVTDGASLLAPETLRQIVEAVIAETDARRAREERGRRDRAVAGAGRGGCSGCCGGGS